MMNKNSLMAAEVPRRGLMEVANECIDLGITALENMNDTYCCLHGRNLQAYEAWRAPRERHDGPDSLYLKLTFLCELNNCLAEAGRELRTSM